MLAANWEYGHERQREHQTAGLWIHRQISIFHNLPDIVAMLGEYGNADAGGYAHEVMVERKTVSVLACSSVSATPSVFNRIDFR